MKISRLILLFSVIIGLTPKLLAAPVSSSLLSPPFVRQWTKITGDYTTVIAVRDGLVYYYSGSGVGALDLETGNLKWKYPAVGSVAAARLGRGAIYAAVDKDEKSEIVAIDVDSGESQSLTQFNGSVSTMELDGRQIYILTDSAWLLNLSLESKRPLWMRDLSAGKPTKLSSVQFKKTPRALYAGISDLGEFGVDPADGRILWKRPSEYAGLYRAAVSGNNIITGIDAVKCFDAWSGKLVWKSGNSTEDLALVGDTLIGTSSDNVWGRDVKNGHVLWRLPIRDINTSYMGTIEVPPVTGSNLLWLQSDPMMCVSQDGREVWYRPEPLTGRVTYADDKCAVTNDGERLFKYVAGSLPKVPTSPKERRALAEKMVADFELLDHTEQRRLTLLSPFVFRPLLSHCVVLAKRDAADSNGAGDDRTSLSTYSLLTEMMPLLAETFRKEDSQAVLNALPAIGEDSRWGSALVEILKTKGDQALYVPFLIKRLRLLPLKERGRSLALKAVAHSRLPEAMAFMLEILSDKKMPQGWRSEAFMGLADTGSAAGLDAVRSARPRRAARQAWFEMLDFSKLPKEAVVSTKKDVKGRTWMLFHNAVLGNYSDLFVVQKVGAKWDRPVFTGAWTERTFNHEAPKTYRHIPTARLAATEWISIFPGDAAIRRDTDGDRLTDIVEARLSTNPKEKDTDRDGLNDSIDPCPNAAPRALNDDEKIIAACMDAHFFESDWGAPAIITAEKTRPFEFYGYNRPVIWERPGSKLEMYKFYGGGVNVISFYNPDDESRKVKRHFIVYSADRKTARTLISRYSGGLNGGGSVALLKKFGNDWVVARLEMKYIS